MIFLLVQADLADSCCSTGGAQPTLLSSCDALGVAFGVGRELETGGWSWKGSWSGVGDDGGGPARFTVAMMRRFAPWLQGGLQVLVELSLDRLDGTPAPSAGPGSGLVWLSLDTPPGWPSATTPHLGLDLGLGSRGLHGRPRVQLGLRLSGERGPWTAWGSLTARFPRLSKERPDGDLALVVDRRFLPTLRAGPGSGLLGAAAPRPAMRSL